MKKYLYPLMAALLLAVVAVLFFVPDVFEGNVLQQHDTVQGLANGHEGQVFEAATGEQTRWTDSLFGGMPNFQIAPSYPANDLLSWISRVYTLGLPAPAGLLFAMMLGFYIMCLCFRMKWSTSLFASLAWGFSTYFIIIIGAGHIWKFITLAYIPPTIGAIYLCYRGKYLYGTALTALFAALQLQGNHPQMTYYFLFAIFFLMLAWLWTAVREKQVKRWVLATLCALGGGIVAVGANSASLYLSYEYSKETVRGRSTELTVKADDDNMTDDGMDRSSLTAWSYGVDETLTLLVPNVKGGATLKPVGGQNEILSVADTEEGARSMLSPQEIQWAGQFSQYFGDQPMTNGPVYVGAFVLILAILAMFVVDGSRFGPMKWALFAACILSILLAWGHNLEPLSNFFIDHVPFYSKFRAPASMLVVLEFCVPFLAALCVVKICDTPDFLQRYGTTFYCVAGLGALICLVGAISPSVFGQPFSVSEMEFLQDNGLLGDPSYAGALQLISDARLGLVRGDCLRSLAFIVVGSLICWMYMRGIVKSKTVFTLMLAVVVTIDLFSVNKRYVNHDNFVPATEAQSELEMTPADASILRDKSHYRVLDLDNFSGARSSYFHKTLGGYHAAKLTRYNDLMERQIKQGNPAVVNMLNAKYFISQGQVVPNPEALGNAWFVERVDYVDGADKEMAALDSLTPATVAVADRRFSSALGQASPVQPRDTIYLTKYAPNRLDYKYRSAKGGVAVFSEIYFPWGWSAEVDGKPLEIGRVDYVLRALKLPAGQHEIVFRFDPKSVKVTNAVGITSVVIIYVLCGLSLAAVIIAWGRRQKKTGKKAEKTADKTSE